MLTILLNELAFVHLSFMDGELHGIALNALLFPWKVFGSMLVLIGCDNLPTFSQLKVFYKRRLVKLCSFFCKRNDFVCSQHKSLWIQLGALLG